MNKFATFVSVCILAVSCAGSTANYDLIPYPESLTPRAGVFQAAGAAFACDPALDDASKAVVDEFAAQLAAVSGTEVKVSADGTESPCFIFSVDTILPAEKYILDIDRNRAVVRASSLRGFVYAVETIKQLLPNEIYGTQPAPDAEWSVPCVLIEDSPRFGYRGLEIDVARHFFDVAQMKRIINLMAMHKLNTLHWHLTDDQGWRIEIKKYPRLTEYGSIRKQTVIKKEWDNYDGTPYGGYFTQDEIRDVVAYAASKGITVIPEIDLPGHMLAALASYPELGCTGGPYEVWGRWGVADDVLCAGNEKIYGFIEDVLTEVMDMFPSKYIHIGGDECPKVRWEHCPKCQARIKELGLKGDGKHSAEQYLQSYVMARVEKFLNEHGRDIIGWDEILEGELAPGATVMSWRGSEGGIEAASMGHDAIMTPTSHFYFDYYQSEDVDNEPFGIGGYVPVEKVYGYEPYADGMSEEACRHIIGVQANLWSEYIATPEHQEYMLLPRMAALCEVQWCRPEVKDWERFLESLSHMADRYAAAGYTFATTAFEIFKTIRVNPNKGCVEVIFKTQGNAPVHYTLDGSEPTLSSPLYTAPIEIREGCTLKAKVFRDNMQTRTYEQTFTASKALGHNAWLNTQPAPKYLFGGALAMTDGVESGFSYGNGAWVGWLNEPLDITVDMGGKTAYSSVRLGTMVQKGEWIFPPKSVTVSVSDDNENFTEVGTLPIAMESESDPDGLKSYTVTFPEVSARYLRVTAPTVDSMPEWHGAAGEKSYLFADEIIVE